MKKLVSGIHTFRETIFEPMRKYFERLGSGQSPRALFISCSDSRVSADLITQADPGDLFVLRNAGNLVPPYGATNGGEGATIEYAVSHLKIRNIIICGHSGCGAMTGLMNPKALVDSPAVTRWLQHAEATRIIALERAASLPKGELVNEAARANVLVQIENLRSHPAVAAGIMRGDIFLHGWYYHFTAGEIFAYDPDKARFISVQEASPVTTVPPGRAVDSLPSRASDPIGAEITKRSQPSFDTAAKKNLVRKKTK